MLLTLISSCSKPTEEKVAKSQTLSVEVAAPIKSVITQWDEYTGRFTATQQVDIRARVSGYLDKVNFKDGQLVEQVYAYEKRVEPRQRTTQKNSVPQKEVDRRQNEHDVALANLAIAKLDLEFTEVKTSIDGVVSRDLINDGNLINGSANNATLLTNVISIDPIHFYFTAGERDLLRYIR